MARCTIGRVFTVVLFATVSILLYTLMSDYRSSQVQQNLPSVSPRVYKLLQKGLPILNQSVINEVDTFLFFIGYPRSGHSIIASCLDAHPDAIVAHEFNIFSKLLYPKLVDQLLNKTILYSALVQNSFRQSLMGWRSDEQKFKDKKGYTLKFNSSSSWQGKFRRLKVIGDKSGGLTAHVYRSLPGPFVKVYQELSDAIGVPVRVLHVVRNPYDMVATRLLFRLSEEKGKKASFSAENRITNARQIMAAVKSLESEVQAVYELINKLKLSTLEVHSGDFVSNTKTTVGNICAFLGLECSESYLEMCASSVYNPNQSRTVVKWHEASKKSLDQLIHNYSFFKRYSFDST